MNNIKIGIQLYTVREILKEGFKNCLKKLAVMGYDGVEFAGNYGDMEPEQLAEFLHDIGLVVCGMHLPLEAIMDKEHEAYRYAEAIDCRYLITSLQNNFAEEIEQRIGDCIKAAETADSQGLCFAYHNHCQEFSRIGSEYALDKFLAATSPGLVNAELDSYWIAHAGVDPVAYMRQYTDRLPLIHLKDMDCDNGGFAAVGTGVIDVPGVIQVAVDSIAEWLIYEQDKCISPPMECARTSIVNIRRFLPQV